MTAAFEPRPPIIETLGLAAPAAPVVGAEVTIPELAPAVLAPVVPIETAVEADPAHPNIFQRMRGFIGRHSGKLAVSATALSLGVSLTADPLHETVGQLREVAPAVGTGIVVSEALLCTGAAMMVGAVGDKIGLNPFALRKKMEGIATKANNSKLFKTGFWLSTIGGAGDSLVVGTGVVTQMPVHSWGVLALGAADLGLTYAVRRKIYNGVKNNAAVSEEPLVAA